MEKHAVRIMVSVALKQFLTPKKPLVMLATLGAREK